MCLVVRCLMTDSEYQVKPTNSETLSTRQLSFRSVQKTITEIKQKICTLLQIYDCDQPNQSAIKQLETAINTYLKSNVDSFDTTQNLEVSVHRCAAAGLTH